MEKDAEKERERKAWAFTMHFESVKYRYIYADGWMCAYGRKCHRCRSCLGALLGSSTLHHQITKKRKISKFESFFFCLRVYLFLVFSFKSWDKKDPQNLTLCLEPNEIKRRHCSKYTHFTINIIIQSLCSTHRIKRNILNDVQHSEDVTCTNVRQTKERTRNMKQQIAWKYYVVIKWVSNIVVKS